MEINHEYRKYETSKLDQNKSTENSQLANLRNKLTTVGNDCLCIVGENPYKSLLCLSIAFIPIVGDLKEIARIAAMGAGMIKCVDYFFDSINSVDSVTIESSLGERTATLQVTRI